MATRNFLTLKDWSGNEIEGLLDLAADIKSNPRAYRGSLAGMTLAMIFMKPSTRTRVSFEAGMTQLGGHAIYLDYRATNPDREALKDEVRCIAGYTQIITGRVYAQSQIEEIAEAANAEGVPVINALSNEFHSCQTLADLFTVREVMESGGIKIAYVGDGNNVCNDLIIGASKLGIRIAVATPKGYEPLREAVMIGQSHGMLTLTNSVEEAVRGADFVYTDTWVSMGQEDDGERRLQDFAGYTVTMDVLGNAYFMHCLPAHRGVEVTDEVIDSPQSVVFQQAANRMQTEQAVMLRLLGKA